MSVPKSSVVIFGSGRPVTCAVMDGVRRLCSAINAQRPGFASMQTIEPSDPIAFVRAIVAVLREGRLAHFELPIEGWGNSIIPGSALMAARLATRSGQIVITLHEWTSIKRLRFLSMIPDILAADGFIFVSPRQRAAFLSTPLVGASKKQRAPVIGVGSNIMPAGVDPDLVARERAKVRQAGNTRADIVIGYFGVLYASKQPAVLLRTVKALMDRGVKTRLLVCGDFLSDKPRDRAAFFDLARQLGVSDWLDFRGRIDDEGELMATLSAPDVFLLPFSDGISARRGSFQAVSQLPIPLVSTRPERHDEFDQSSVLKSKIENAATALCPIDADGNAFASAILSAVGHRQEAIGLDLSRSWEEAASAHLAFYDRLAHGESRSTAPGATASAARQG